MSGETAAERRARRRAEEAGLTEEQLAHREDEAYARSRWVLRLLASLPRKVREGQVRLRNRPPTKGRPPGPSLTIEDLERTVDRMRRNGAKLSQRTLAEQVPVGLSTLTDWLADRPGVWQALQTRYRGR